MKPLTIRDWPRAILHIDADAFFVGVEQAVHPELKGKAVITGAERGIVTAASYEAKAMGIQRGVSLTEASHICPDLVMLPSDYETYSLYSKRMFDIVRRFTPEVEEYSIDECFADITGMRRVHHSSYKAIAKKIQDTIKAELDISVSIGISLSKSLAKLCSKYRKPQGITAVPGKYIHVLLKRTEISQVWGFGKNTTALLQKHGCNTALDFAKKPRPWVDKLLGKVGLAIWDEFHGDVVNDISTNQKTSYATISKTKTFAPGSEEPNYIFAQALRNLESACMKARRYNLAAGEITLSLREKDFSSYTTKTQLRSPSNAPMHLAPILRELFAELRRTGATYRSTAIVLGKLRPNKGVQTDLFEDNARVAKANMASDMIDEVNRKHGKRTMFLSDGLHLGANNQQHMLYGRRGSPGYRKQHLLPGENARQRVALPLLDYKLS